MWYIGLCLLLTFIEVSMNMFKPMQMRSLLEVIDDVELRHVRGDLADHDVFAIPLVNDPEVVGRGTRSQNMHSFRVHL